MTSDGNVARDCGFRVIGTVGEYWHGRKKHVDLPICSVPDCDLKRCNLSVFGTKRVGARRKAPQIGNLDGVAAWEGDRLPKSG